MSNSSIDDSLLRLRTSYVKAAARQPTATPVRNLFRYANLHMPILVSFHRGEEMKLQRYVRTILIRGPSRIFAWRPDA
jgi:hypothetical protein